MLLSSAYVLGMATSYAFAGIIAATFGAQGNLQAYMQNPWVISVFAGVFVALSLSMFGLYNLALPSKLQNALYNLSNKQKGGHFFGVFVMGALSALVVSPCVSAPLAGALVFISSTGDKLVGGLALFALGIGMGLPLIAIGAGGGKLVPKAGVWMNHVKHFFGVILLAVAIWLVSRIIPASVTIMLWAVLFIAYGIHNGALEPATGDIARLGKAASFLMLVYGTLLFIGAMSGGTDPLKPLQFTQGSSATATIEKPLFTRIKNDAELTQAIALAKQQNKPVMLDFYADWCTACIDMEKNVFSKAETHAALAGFVVLQIDVTKNTKDDKAVLNRFNLFGPPSILFFKNGEQLKEKSLQGEMLMADFIKHVQSIE
jgi:thiol:disulfide interchange protein DsbD